jgi:hypothetical protein
MYHKVPREIPSGRSPERRLPGCDLVYRPRVDQSPAGWDHSSVPGRSSGKRRSRPNPPAAGGNGHKHVSASRRPRDESPYAVLAGHPEEPHWWRGPTISFVIASCAVIGAAVVGGAAGTVLLVLPFFIVVVRFVHHRTPASVEWTLAIVLAFIGCGGYVVSGGAQWWNWGQFAVYPLVLLIVSRRSDPADPSPRRTWYGGSMDGPWGHRHSCYRRKTPNLLGIVGSVMITVDRVRVGRCAGRFRQFGSR